MQNRSLEGCRSVGNARNFASGWHSALIAAAWLTGCFGKAEETRPAAPADLGNVRLSDAQRGHIQIYDRPERRLPQDHRDHRCGRFRQRSGHQCVGPFSGPVSRLLVSLGQQGEEGRRPGRGGFAGFCRGDQRLSKGARHRADQSQAGGSRPGSARAQRCRAARGGAGRDRRRQRRGGPRRGAAGTRVAAGAGRNHQGDSGGAQGGARRGHDPCAGRRHRGGETGDPRSTARKRARRRASRWRTCRVSG
jgi:hypothetical protein